VFPPADALRERLPARLRESLRPLPTRTLWAATAAIGVVVVSLVVAVVVVSVRVLSRSAPKPALSAQAHELAAASASASAAVAGTVRQVSSAELDLARKQGPLALEALAAKYPLDAQLLVEAAQGFLAIKDYVKATGAAGRALAVDASVNQDNALALVLFQTAQSHVAADAAFALLEAPMGARGAQVIWDLAAEPAVAGWVRQRAGQWLRSPDFRKVAAPSLLVAADLRTAATCQAAQALLPLAKANADERSLPQLVAWTHRTGCGRRRKHDCMPCLRSDSALDDAIAAIRARKKEH
jgi:hypothetical protein